MGEEPLLLQRSCGQAGVQRRQRRQAGTSPRLGHRSAGYAAILRARRASSGQGVVHPGWGGVTRGTGTQVRASDRGREDPKISEESTAV